MSMASLIFLLCQFSSRSRIFTSLIEDWWPVFNLCSLTADRFSLIGVPSGLAVSPCSVGRFPAIGCHIPPTLCRFVCFVFWVHQQGAQSFNI